MRRIGGSLAAVAALALAAPAGGAAAGYPDPPPDFAHAGTPQLPRWTPDGGANDRPLLVIYVGFRDVDFPAGTGPAMLARRAFGGFPSIADYWAKQSFGALAITPAPETDASDSGRAGDGVVRVRIPVAKAVVGSRNTPVDNALILRAADQVVDFAAFDRDGDGRLTDSELVTLRVDADTAALPAGGAVTRGVAPVTLDETVLDDLDVAQTTTATNLITAIHETWHVLFNNRDFYGFGVGWFDITAPTVGAPDSSLVGLAAWNRLRLGWGTPAVVTRDGYRELRATGDAGADAAILYDPQRGTGDFFIVEARRRRAGSYDQSVRDNGLLIWRVDTRHYASTDDLVRPVEIMRPDGTAPPPCSDGCYGGSDSDAWDPADAGTPQRTMDRPWRDGTPANVAVRAIGSAGERVRAYFDVRGPGVLVDSYALNTRAPLALQAGHVNQVNMPVMNTGEATGSFVFAVAGLPAGWTATGETLTLGPGAAATAAIRIAPTGASGPVTLTVTGRSATDPAVRSDAPLVVAADPSPQLRIGPPPKPAFTVHVGAAARQRALRSKRLTVSARCSQACRLTPRIEVLVRVSGRLHRFKDRASFAATGTKIRISLSPAGRRRIDRALRARRRVEVRVAIDAKSKRGAGRARAATRVRIIG